MQTFSQTMAARPCCRPFSAAAAGSRRPMGVVAGLATEKENPFAEELKVTTD